MQRCEVAFHRFDGRATQLAAKALKARLYLYAASPLFNGNKGIDFSLFRSLAQKVVDRILEIELKRGDSETQVTSLAEELSYDDGRHSPYHVRKHNNLPKE